MTTNASCVAVARAQTSAAAQYALTAFVFLVALLWGQLAAAELSIDGDCVNDTRWSATLLNQGSGGLATFNKCAPGSDLLVMKCTPDSPNVEIRIEVPSPDMTALQSQTGTLTVDNTEYTLTGVAQFSEMLGGAYPVFKARRTDPIFAALSNGTSAQLTTEGPSVSMHLSGSATAISAMFEGCS